MNGDLLYVWNAPTYIIKFVISIKTALCSRLINPIFRPCTTACKITAFLRITQYLKTYNFTITPPCPRKAELTSNYTLINVLSKRN